MAQPLPTRSRKCLQHDHAGCPHFAGLEDLPSLWRPWQWRSAPGYVVCDCDCHSDCPLAGERTVTSAMWRERCACSGAEPVRAKQERVEELKRDLATVTQGLRSSGRWDAQEVERRLSDVYRSRGEAVPPG